MGTRSDIIVERADGKWARTYCHWDGYVSHNGQLLVDHYASQERAEALSALGSLSSLAPSIEKPEGHTFGSPVPGYTVAYGRDRGEADTEAEVFDSLFEAWPETDTWTEFTYVWTQDQWWVGDAEEGSQGLRLVCDVLAGDDVIAPRVFVPFLGRIGRHSANH